MGASPAPPDPDGNDLNHALRAVLQTGPAAGIHALATGNLNRMLGLSSADVWGTVYSTAEPNQDAVFNLESHARTTVRRANVPGVGRVRWRPPTGERPLGSLYNASDGTIVDVILGGDPATVAAALDTLATRLTPST